MSDRSEAWEGWNHERAFPFDPRDKAIREAGITMNRFIERRKEGSMPRADELEMALDAAEKREAELLVVIAEAPHEDDCRTRLPANWANRMCDCWKSRVDTSALARHDAEVRATALEDAADGMDAEEQYNHADWLRDRAAARREGK